MRNHWMKTAALGALLGAAALQPIAASAQEVAAPTAARTGPSGGDIVGYGQIHHPEIGRGGMVVSQNEFATRVGTAILRRGGNAVDAAVAVGFAEAVTLPRAGNIGGGGYMLIHMVATKDRPATTIAIDYYGQASRNTMPDLLLGADGKMDKEKDASFKGVAIPGTVAGLWEAHRRFGRLPWKKLVQPAIDLARKGVVMSDDEAQATAARKSAMADDPGATRAFFKADGSAYRPGEVFRQPDLVWSLTQIRDGGADAFYRGKIAERVAAAMKSNGGVIDARDLADYKAIVSEPVWSSYRGQKIAYMPPTASGITVAQAMNMLERWPMKDYRWGSVASLHLISEAMKIAWSDRRFVGGGPDWKTPTAGLASKVYAVERAKLISLDRSLNGKTLPEGNPYPHESPDTTHYSVADAEGNAVSNTYTLSASYGAHVVAPGTGFLLNNSLGNLAWGSADEARKATRPAPNKRVGSTITPLIVFKNGKPWLVTGTPGGGYITATMVQLLVNVMDHGLNVAEAAQRPRINQGGPDAALELEEGFSPDIVPLLEAKGHKVKPSNTMGSTQSIMIEGDLFLGAADSRRPDALAQGVK